MKVAFTGLIVNLAVNYYSYADTLNIAPLRVALIIRLFTN